MADEQTEHQDKTLVEQHALEKLNKVETERARAYKKHRHPLRATRVIMVVVMLVVLAIMIYSLL